MSTTPEPQPAAPKPAGAVEHHIRAELPNLSVALASVGRWLLENLDAPLRMSIVELAHAAHTSPSTITRFCRQIGFEGYGKLKVALAADLGRSSATDSWASAVAQEIDTEQPLGEMFADLMRHHLETLQNTARQVDLEVVARVAEACAKARHIDLYGIGGSALIARELQERLYRIGLTAYVWEESHIGVTSAALLDENCVAIAVSSSGRTREVVDMVSRAAAAGALTVAVTHHPNSIVADVCDYTISTVVAGNFMEPYGLSFRHAQYLLADILYLAIARENMKRTSRALEVTAQAVAHLRYPENKGSDAEVVRLRSPHQAAKPREKQ